MSAYTRPAPEISEDLHRIYEEIKFIPETRHLVKDFKQCLVDMERLGKILSYKAPKLDYTKAVRMPSTKRKASPYNQFVKDTYAEYKERGEECSLLIVAMKWRDHKRELKNTEPDVEVEEIEKNLDELEL